MPEAKSVLTKHDNHVLVVTINRPQARNAVDSQTALALVEVFEQVNADDDLRVAILTGAQGTFCAGADLREVAQGNRQLTRHEKYGPMGPSWMLLNKPVIAAVEGHAV